MPFSAATCITFNPQFQSSTGPFNIYVNNDYDSDPINEFPIPLSLLSGINCPYIIEVPEGTTTLGLRQENDLYCITIDIQNNDICSNCNLGLSLYSAATPAVITAGVLTGTCQNIVDYKINWYGPDDTTTLQFSSGSGVFSGQSTYTHPWEGEGRSIPSIAGVYTPVIDKVKISGITYSNTGEDGTILFDGSCLPTTNVLPLTCEVRTNTRQDYPYSAYSQVLAVKTVSSSPQTVSSTFKISADTKYIAWVFQGFRLPDRLTISLSGASYGTTIIGLEDIVIGFDPSLTTNLTPNLYPKSANTGNNPANLYRKITTLTGLTISDNDDIIIKVESSVSDTLWNLYLNCLSDFDCDDCKTNKSIRKIIGSTISPTPQDCGTLNVSFSISGCTITEDINSDLNTYYGFNKTYNQIDEKTIELTNFFSTNVYNPKRICGTLNCGFFNQPACTSDSSPTKYDKTFLLNGKGVFGFTGSSTFISTYYNSWLTKISICWTNPPPTELDYYRAIQMCVPSVIAPNNCDDNVTFSDQLFLALHPTSTIFTGTTISGGETLYYMKITANTITNQFPEVFTDCDQNCNIYFNNRVRNINDFSTGTTQDYRPNPTATPFKEYSNGIYYQNPIYIEVNTINDNDYRPIGRLTSYFDSSTSIGNTYPFSGTPANNPSPSSYTIIPSLSGTVCNYNQSGVRVDRGTYQIFRHYLWDYELRLPNINSDTDFEIWTTPINNYLITPTQVLVYRISGGTTYFNPIYII